MITLRTTRFRI